MVRTHATSAIGAAEGIMLWVLSALWNRPNFFFKVLMIEWPPFAAVPGRVGFATFALNEPILQRERKDAST